MNGAILHRIYENGQILKTYENRQVIF